MCPAHSELKGCKLHVYVRCIILCSHHMPKLPSLTSGIKAERCCIGKSTLCYILYVCACVLFRQMLQLVFFPFFVTYWQNGQTIKSIIKHINLVGASRLIRV